MYEAPPRKKLEVYASIPKNLHVTNRHSAWSNVQHGTQDSVFLEGPSFDAFGNLWVVDIPWGRLFKIDVRADISCELEYDGEPNGMVFHPDGYAIIADNKNGLMRFDPTTGEIAPLLERPLVQHFKGPNDLTLASNGDLYFTDQGQTGLHDPTGRLYRLTPAGRLDCLLSNVPSPNGLTLNLNEDVIYLAVTRANAVWRVPLVKQHGLVTKVGTYIQMSGGSGPDGMALDERGGLAVSHVGAGIVWIFDDIGQPVLRLDSPGNRKTTNCAYGGPDRKRLFVTAGADILIADVDYAGAPLVGDRGAITSGD